MAISCVAANVEIHSPITTNTAKPYENWVNASANTPSTKAICVNSNQVFRFPNFLTYIRSINGAQKNLNAHGIYNSDNIPIQRKSTP